MQAVAVIAAALSLSTSPLIGQGTPYLSAGVERATAHDAYGAFRSYGGGAALGIRSERGFVQLKADWFRGEGDDPGWASFGMEGGPRLEISRWSLRAHVGAGGIHIGRSARGAMIVCAGDYCPLDIVVAPASRSGWSGYTSAAAGMAWHATPSLDLGLQYRLTGLLLGADGGTHLRGWSVALTRTLR